MQFLAVRPYRELTIPTLMAQTSVERTSFYTSFPSIPALVKEILGRVSAELRTAGWTNYFTLDGDPREQMRQAIDAAIEVWSRHGPMLRAISEAAPPRSRPGRAVVRRGARIRGASLGAAPAQGTAARPNNAGSACSASVR